MKFFWIVSAMILSSVAGSLSVQAAVHATPVQEANCQVAKNSRLAMDQRDGQRLTCLKQKAPQLTVDQCLFIAGTMEYSNNAEDARLVCLYDLKKKIAFKDCSKIARAMEYADSGDDVRWECIRRDSAKISKAQCQNIAKGMSYPGNQQRAELFCEDELR
ncbi:hypothetical protein D3C87_1093380 [compost metagenome]